MARRKRAPHEVDALREQDPATWTAEDCYAIIQDDLDRMTRHADRERREANRRPAAWWVTTTVLTCALVVCSVAALAIVGPALVAVDRAMSGPWGEALLMAGAVAAVAYLLRSRWRDHRR